MHYPFREITNLQSCWRVIGAESESSLESLRSESESSRESSAVLTRVKSESLRPSPSRVASHSYLNQSKVLGAVVRASLQKEKLLSPAVQSLNMFKAQPHMPQPHTTDSLLGFKKHS
jgi:hypothetical protein